MKRFLAVIFICLMIPAASYTEDGCSTIADMAKLMMTSRQIGVPLQTMMALNYSLEENTETERFFKDLMVRLTVDAYSSPLYTSEEYQQKAVTEFSNRHMLKCLKGE